MAVIGLGLRESKDKLLHTSDLQAAHDMDDVSARLCLKRFGRRLLDVLVGCC